MDNERNGVPSGIGPKLPEQQPMAPAKKEFSLSRREIIIVSIAGVLLAALAVWFILFVVTAGYTAQQAVDRHAEEGMAVQEELVQVSLPGGSKSVYFYISGDALACALLQRGASGYRVVESAGHLALSAKDKSGAWMSIVNTKDKKEFLIFGLIYSADLNHVKVDGEAATVVDTGVYKLWYYYGEGNMSINSESVVYS